MQSRVESELLQHVPGMITGEPLLRVSFRQPAGLQATVDAHQGTAILPTQSLHFASTNSLTRITLSWAARSQAFLRKGRSRDDPNDPTAFKVGAEHKRPELGEAPRQAAGTKPAMPRLQHVPRVAPRRGSDICRSVWEAMVAPAPGPRMMRGRRFASCCPRRRRLRLSARSTSRLR